MINVFEAEYLLHQTLLLLILLSHSEVFQDSDSDEILYVQPGAPSGLQEDPMKRRRK